jgi:hypothetical protein
LPGGTEENHKNTVKKDGVPAKIQDTSWIWVKGIATWANLRVHEWYIVYFWGRVYCAWCSIMIRIMFIMESSVSTRECMTTYCSSVGFQRWKRVPGTLCRH